jgi:hypothetical protein
LWSRGVDTGTHQEKQIHEKDDDQDEAADEDVWSEAHHGFVAGKVRRWDVFVLVVAFVFVFGHAHKLTSRMREDAPSGRRYFDAKAELGWDG